MKMQNIIGIFDSDDKLVKAMHSCKEQGVAIADVHAPFASHEILHHLGKESRIPYGSVVAGFLAIVLTFSFLYWTSVISYPIIFGGKPLFAFPSWVVIIYLMTILITFIATVIFFQYRTGMMFGNMPKHVHPESTDDKFVMIIEQSKDMTDRESEKIKRILSENGALEIKMIDETTNP